MGVVIPVGYGQATFVLRCAGSSKDSVWTLGFKDNAFVDAADTAERWVTAFTGTGKTYGLANMSDKWTFSAVKVTYESEVGTLVGEYAQTFVGTASIAPIPLNCAILIRKNTALGGRKNRGRIYLPPASPTESNVDAAGFIGSGDVAGIQSLFDASIADAIADDLVPYLLHSDGTLPTAITSFAVQSRVATQRRRMR